VIVLSVTLGGAAGGRDAAGWIGRCLISCGGGTDPALAGVTSDPGGGAGAFPKVGRPRIFRSRLIASVVGATVLLIGIALLVLPGPAFIVIPLGLAILATEYAWARRWLKRVRRMASNIVSGRNDMPPGDSRA